MIYNKGKTISLYEGDTGTLDIGISGDIQTGDILEFRVKENLSDDNVLWFQRDDDITDGHFTLEITPARTALMHAEDEEDKTYYYGIKLFRDGEVIDTLIPYQKLIIMKEV